MSAPVLPGVAVSAETTGAGTVAGMNVAGWLPVSGKVEVLPELVTDVTR